MPSNLNIRTRLLQQQTKLKHLSARVFQSERLLLSQRTPFEVIAEYKQHRVRYYAAPKRLYREPMVIVPPLAINMSIYDLYPYRSFIQHLTGQGFDVYLVDWGTLTLKDRHLNFLSFIQKRIPLFVDQIREHSGSDQISLHGWSMAGIFVLLYSAHNQPNHVKNLMVMGSPIDAYASGSIGKLYQQLHKFFSRRPRVQQRLYYNMPKAVIHSTGFMNALGFKLLDPKGWIDGHLQLLQNLGNFKSVREHATLGDFLNNMIDYPGGINQDMLFNVWMQNPLKTGEINVHGKIIKLDRINCSLLVGAGKNDQLVTQDAARPLIHLTQSKDVEFVEIPGGHLGMISSQGSADQFWPKLTQWLAERSQAL